MYPTMAFNFANLTKDLKLLSDRVSSEFSSEVLPFAQRQARIVQERLGKVPEDEISQLPLEYTDLAAKCNNIEQLYKNLLKVTSVYSNESYDYPGNLQESLGEMGRDWGSRVLNLSKATTPQEAQQALVNPGTGDFRPPKTLYHALLRASNPDQLATPQQEFSTLPQNPEDPLVKGLTIYSEGMNKIGNARLGQDQLICTKFNEPLTTTLRQLISQLNNIQKKVEQKRIDYDLARLNLASCTVATKEPQLRVVMENAEDEFANTVEDAINIMNNVLANAKPLEEFLELIKAQLAYHKLALELLGTMTTQFEQLVEENHDQDVTAPSDSGDFDI